MKKTFQLLTIAFVFLQVRGWAQQLHYSREESNAIQQELKTFADELTTQANHSKTILVVGHSNTSPRLVNLLLGKDAYKDLDESVYNQYWVVKINGQRKYAKVILY